MEPNTMDGAVAKLSKNKRWIFALFLLTSTPGILNAMHISSYVFLAFDPTVWCDIPELNHANWTIEQIRNISMPDLQVKESCYIYDWNYNYFGQIGYNKSIEVITNSTKPGIISCNKYNYDETPSVVKQWNLVCKRDYLKPLIHASVAGGKLIGALIFGIIADKFGRRKAFIASCLIYMIAGPAAAFIPYFFVFLILRLFIGLAGAGVYECGYTILTEMTVKKYRTNLGILYNLSYSIGGILLPILAYASQDWQQLQIFISVPAFLFIIQYCFLPESPRWLVTEGRYEEASKIIKTNAKLLDVSSQAPNLIIKEIWYTKLFTSIKTFYKIFSYKELRNRLFICQLCWFTAALSYFVIGFNSQNFSANTYIYFALNGLVEAPGYLAPVIILSYIGRKLTSILLFFLSGFSLLIILILPSGTTRVVVALIGRFCSSAVYGVIILYTSELFPTSHRNTAIGTSLTMAQLGTIITPFIVDLLGKKAWYLPSTLCGALCILVGALVLFLPETWNKPLPDTIEDIKESEGRTSLGNSFNFN